MPFAEVFLYVFCHDFFNFGISYDPVVQLKILLEGNYPLGSKTVHLGFLVLSCPFKKRNSSLYFPDGLLLTALVHIV